MRMCRHVCIAGVHLVAASLHRSERREGAQRYHTGVRYTAYAHVQAGRCLAAASRHRSQRAPLKDHAAGMIVWIGAGVLQLVSSVP